MQAPEADPPVQGNGAEAMSKQSRLADDGEGGDDEATAEVRAARAWIRDWRARRLEAKLPQEVTADK